MKKLITTVALFTYLFTLAQNEGNRAANSSQFIVAWDIATTVSSDFVDDTSFSGGKLEYRTFINDRFAWGGSLGWNSYRDKEGQRLYESVDGTTAVYTDMIRQVYELPISVNGYYYFGNGEKVMPYAGLGLGTLYSNQKAFFNVYEIDDHNWGFLMRPEIGLQIMPGSSNVGLHSYISYNYATNSSDSFNLNSLSHFSFGIGILFAF